MAISRRNLLGAAAALGLAPAAASVASTGAMNGGCASTTARPVGLPATPAGVSPQALASDEAFWAQVAASYALTDELALLDNGYFGAMNLPVLQAYQQATAQVNQGNSWFARSQFPALMRPLQEQLAAFLGVASDEIVLTRGATEALQALIGGYNRLAAGDQVLYADVDYDSMIAAMRWLAQRRGVQPVAIALPDPATTAGLLQAYEQALQRHPKVKLLLLTQVNHRNGMLLPVAQIAAMARARGVDVIVDAAHAVGQVTPAFNPEGVDFAGINLHKWVGAPVGVGALYIRRQRLAAIDPYMGQADAGIHSRIHTGTANFAAYLALPTALAQFQLLPLAFRRARLLYLRDHWRRAAAQMPHIQLLGSDEAGLRSAIASFRLRGRTALADNAALARQLRERDGVFTVHRDGLAGGACVRVTPGLFTPLAQMQQLQQALARLG